MRPASARRLVFAVALAVGCGDDGVATPAETETQTGTGTGDDAAQGTMPSDTTQGMVDDGGSESSSSGGSSEGSSSSGEPMGSTTSSSGSGGGESESTTGAPFVCEPIDLGMATGEVATGTTVGENDDILTPCMKFDSVDIEYQWTAPTAGTWQIDTYGSAYDTALLVLAGDCDGAQLACNDDIGTTESAVIVDLEAGETVLVVVDGFGGAEGDFVLHIGEAVPGDCCTPGPFGGCDDPACESAVCSADPSCCNEAWDAACALELAPSLCDECAPPGSCCFAHEDPGCDDVSCEVDVCAKDPTCCSVAWTQACSDLATQLCLECAPGTGNCCAAHVEPGCENVACETLVCNLTGEFCCDFQWDAFCADVAEENCVVCQDPGPCCFPNFGVSCDEPAVAACVCATMPECCTDAWTDACAAQVVAGGCGMCPAADFSCVDTDLGSQLGEVATGMNAGTNDDMQVACMPPGGEDLVFQWTSPSAGTYVFDTYGTDYDVGLAILHPDCSADPLECQGNFGQFAETITLDVPAGITLVILLDGFGPTTGTYVLNINPPPGQGFCCLANGTPGCNVASCQQEVCAIDDTCCTGFWDDACAALAQANCAACTPESLGDCCTGHPGNSGCDDLSCAENVCSFDPYCCDVAWEDFCGNEAEMWCVGLCG